MTYKGYYYWFNDLQGKWIVQCGYTLVHTANTQKGAKAWITRDIKRG